MIRRPTRKAAIVSSVGLLLVAVASTAQAGWLFVLAAGVLGLAASGFLASHRLVACAVTRSVPARARVGEDVTIGLRVRNTSPRRLPVMRIEDRFGAVGEIVVAAESIPGGATAQQEFPRRALRRGVFDAGPVDLSTSAPFGLTRTRRRGFVSSRMIVHPHWVPLRRFSLPEARSVIADDAPTAATLGHGDLFAGVRDYRPGDLQKWIHWRTTARSGRLVVREHEEPTRSAVVLLLAGSDVEDEETSSWEPLVSAAASVGAFALARGRRVNCARVGDGGTVEHLESPTRLQMLDWLAGADPVDGSLEDLASAAVARWGPRCSFVVVGSTRGRAGRSLAPAAATLRAGGAGVLVVCDPPRDAAEQETVASLRRTFPDVRVVAPSSDLTDCLQP